MRLKLALLITSALLILLPLKCTLAQFTISNQVPNPGFVGKDGSNAGNAIGEVPLNWRAFAVSAGTRNLERLSSLKGTSCPAFP